MFRSSLLPLSRIVIVGGVAGGATAAARIHRLNPSIECTVVERGRDVSFANCGLPYHIGHEIQEEKALHLHTPQSLASQTGARVLIESEAFDIDRVSKLVKCRSLAAASAKKEFDLPYDKLILAPGAAPILPPIPGLHEARAKGAGIFVLRTIDDMKWIEGRVAAKSTRHIAVIGGGFIGLEMCEQLRHIGCKVTLVEGAPHVMPPVDEDFSKLIERHLRKEGVGLHLGRTAARFAFEPGQSEDIRIQLQQAPGGATTGADAQKQQEGEDELVAQVVVMCIGVRPESQVAKQAGLALGPRGHIIVDPFMRTATDPNIYAVGDAVETNDGVFPDTHRATVPLGNVANQQARIAADHAVTGASLPYPGSIGTAIVRCFRLTCAVTGWSEARLRAAKIPFETATVTAYDHAGYYPGATPVHMKAHYCPDTGRVLGAQAIGENGVDKRIDVFATAITGRMTVDQLSVLQVAYAPPFGAARDVVNTAALHARNKQAGLKAVASPKDIAADEVLLDVRKPEQYKEKPSPFQHVHAFEIESRLGELDKSKKYVTVCQWGRMSYFAALSLTRAGFQARTLSGGVAVHFPEYDTEKGKPNPSKL